MSEKPFWEGKTCEEMAGLPVKAVFKNGVTITGQLSRFGDIPISTEGMNSPISISSNTLNFRPHREISSVELLDSLEYERIDNIEDVREAQVHVSYRNAGKTQNAVDAHEGVDTRRFHPSLECDVQRRPEIQADSRESGRQTMRDKAMPLGKKFKVRLTITPEETGTPVDMLGFTFTSGRNGRMELDTEYNNIPKLADDGLDSLSILVILKTLEMWAQKGYELFQPIAQRFHGDGR